MRVFVVIATKGRAPETKRLLDYLQKQTRAPDFTVIAGTEQSDLEGIETHGLIASAHGAAVVSRKVGSSAQRNFGLEVLEQRGYFDPAAGRFFCAFFDDDYRPADDWLEQASRRFQRDSVVGLTGQILADGVKRGGLTEAEAVGFLDGSMPPEAHWASGPDEGETTAVYGCNMAFTDTVIREIRFDENLPLYGWQEDRDYTGMAQRMGRVIYCPKCVGVHLGVRRGRTSGLKFGYSQIANPLYLMKKGTMGYKIGMRFILRAMAANLARGIGHHSLVDYRGRLQGNMRALRDVICRCAHPSRITASTFETVPESPPLSSKRVA